MSEKRDIQYELKELQNTLTGPDSERAWDVVRYANDEITMLNMKYAALQQVSSAMAELLTKKPTHSEFRHTYQYEVDRCKECQWEKQKKETLAAFRTLEEKDK